MCRKYLGILYFIAVRTIVSFSWGTVNKGVRRQLPCMGTLNGACFSLQVVLEIIRAAVLIIVSYHCCSVEFFLFMEFIGTVDMKC